MAQEVDYKYHFVKKYGFRFVRFDIETVDVVVYKNKKDEEGYTNPILYIESKYFIPNQVELNRALTQAVLTNKKQKKVLTKIAVIYKDTNDDDILTLIDLSDDDILYNNDINWSKEKPSSPTKDAIDAITVRIKNHITTYKNNEIKELYQKLLKGDETQISITLNNFNTVFTEWKNTISFTKEVKNEQDNINLFLVDILNGEKYKTEIKEGLYKGELQDVVREGTNLNNYEILYDVPYKDEISIKYDSASVILYQIKDAEVYKNFWLKYKRPPAKDEFLKILERSDTLYSREYRRTTGAEYTPSCFVKLQNQMLEKHYGKNWKDEYIVFDPCAGVGNLQNEFGLEYKQFCFLSTLEQKDVDILKIKGFQNAIGYDYLKNDEQPLFKFGGEHLPLTEIAKRLNKKIMVIMNPPYQNIKGHKNNLAIEFFNKVLKINPETIVFYYMTESFLRSEVQHYIDSGYKIVSHNISNAKTTFLLSEWPISQVIFDKVKGESINLDCIPVNRYEVDKTSDRLQFVKTYNYNNSRPNLYKELDYKINLNKHGMKLGNYGYMSNTINLSNNNFKNSFVITTENLKYCLLSKGINFNTDDKYFERNTMCYRGEVEDIPQELFNDSIMFSMFYLKCAFSNKGQKNYIMPFKASELGCSNNDLNVLYSDTSDLGLFDENKKSEEPFDFRVFFHQFEYSKEAKDLYQKALKIFRWYHSNKEYKDKDYNDSFYDITNTIMGKDPSQFASLDTDNDTRISKTKTTKGTKGFGKKTIKSVVSSKDLPLFYDFFDARDVLAKKINRQLVESGLLLWERENIY